MIRSGRGLTEMLVAVAWRVRRLGPFTLVRTKSLRALESDRDLLREQLISANLTLANYHSLAQEITFRRQGFNYKLWQLERDATLLVATAGVLRQREDLLVEALELKQNG